MDFEGSSPDHFEYISHRARYFEYEYRRRKQTYTIVLVSMFLLTLIFSVLFLLPPVQGILSKKEQLLAAQVEGIKKIPDIESKLEKLQSQIQLLTTESIDTRLTKVETAIGSGSVKADQVKSFWQLAKEIDTLKGYMFKDPKELVELKELQKNYSSLASTTELYATKESVNSQISTIQTILGISLGFFGLLFTVVFGSWWFIGRKPQVVEVPTRSVHRPLSATEEHGE
ncbi:TPA: hypothetical protein L4810_006780 [Pseudomonas aeruginosa]|uniref:hypothetical protein n=2 Tax=Pseudomonas TaxID=286 RepID=UPI0003B99EF3|nr:hypothetical protein [Pseudomonas aeruginosa]EIU2725214.1 hypothetical protein [Pseudomonas aeruginosa]EIU2834816.1 hypothetical protein [Pseudomonas aeruginosa]EIU2838659.1 hypothetical protein [Pseudomonas aeruginosa]EIU2865541.1 hypothetical protein [Pseudomonas aeruginosa]EIU2871422.1 hypothetical protein [Pseudomonas aeruginosa]